MANNEIADYLLITAVIALSYFFVPLFLLPTRLFLTIGKQFKIEDKLQYSIFLSPNESTISEIRQEMFFAITEGAHRILEHEGISSFPVSRHHLIEKARQAPRATSSKFESGENVLSLSMAVLALVIAIVTNTSVGPFLANLLLTVSTNMILSRLSLVLATLGAMSLLLARTRNIVTQSLILDVQSNKAMSTEELFTRMVWNDMVSETPGKALKLYYMVFFCQFISEDAKDRALEAFVDGMDPEISSWEGFKRHTMPLGELIVDGMLE